MVDDSFKVNKYVREQPHERRLPACCIAPATEIAAPVLNADTTAGPWPVDVQTIAQAFVYLAAQ
jgi:hypothetical protein